MVDNAHILAALLETQLENDSIHTFPISEAFAKANTHKFKATIFKHSKTSLGTNAYITDSKGVIILDTTYPQRLGQDYSQFNDVHLALQDKYAVRSSRIDESDENSSVLHVAAPIKSSSGKILGVISIYKSQQDLRPFIEARRHWITFSLFLIGIGITTFTIAVFYWLFRPLGKLTKYANALGRDERPPFPNLGEGREANTLGNALREMRRSLDGRSYTENYTRMLTHELKSPLAAIKGAAELMSENMPEAQRRKFLTNIRREAERSTSIIDGLLKLSQLEATSELPKPTPTDIEKLIHEVTQNLQPRLQAKSIKLQTILTKETTIPADPAILTTAISNLLENAISHSPSNSVITIQTSKVEQQILLTITDQGSGIPKYAQDRIFEHFYSLPSENKSHKSSGLGLPFVSEAAKLHSGTITIESTPSNGTKATLTLPNATNSQLTT